MTCEAVLPCYIYVMVDAYHQSAADRIDRALARIEAALIDRAASHDTLALRHAVLRRRMGEAVRLLDGVLTGPNDQLASIGQGD